jgi:hypothetical protein
MVSDRNPAPGEGLPSRCWVSVGRGARRHRHRSACSVWSLTRLVYRSLEILEERQLIVPADRALRARPELYHLPRHPGRHAAVGEGSSSPSSTSGRAGRASLKLVFATTRVDPRPMLLAQRDAIEDAISSLEARVRRVAALMRSSPIPPRVLTSRRALHRRRARRAEPAARAV